MIILLSMGLCVAGLTLQALCEPGMRRFACLPRRHMPVLFTAGRFLLPLIALLVPLWARPITAIFIWAGAFSISAIIVSAIWTILAYYRRIHRS